MKKSLILITIAILGLIWCGCGDQISGGGGNDKLYSADGLLFYNPNTDQGFCYALILEETDPITSLDTYFRMSPTDSVRMNYLGAGAYLTPSAGVSIAPDSTYSIMAINDDASFYMDQDLVLADTFRVQVLSPASRVYSGGTVSLAWNAPSQDFGYFLTVEAPSSEAVPYTIFVNSVNNVTIPADAFANSTGERITGIYKFYVVAYSETFYSNPNVEAGDKIFFPYPDSGFVDNIDELDLSGRFGAAIISYYDSVEVIEQP